MALAQGTSLMFSSHSDAGEDYSVQFDIGEQSSMLEQSPVDQRRMAQEVSSGSAAQAAGQVERATLGHGAKRPPLSGRHNVLNETQACGANRLAPGGVGVSNTSIAFQVESELSELGTPASGAEGQQRERPIRVGAGRGRRLQGNSSLRSARRQRDSILFSDTESIQFNFESRSRSQSLNPTPAAHLCEKQAPAPAAADGKDMPSQSLLLIEETEAPEAPRELFYASHRTVPAPSVPDVAGGGPQGPARVPGRPGAAGPNLPRPPMFLYAKGKQGKLVQKAPARALEFSPSTMGVKSKAGPKMIPVPLSSLSPEQRLQFQLRQQQLAAQQQSPPPQSLTSSPPLAQEQPRTPKAAGDVEVPATLPGRATAQSECFSDGTESIFFMEDSEFAVASPANRRRSRATSQCNVPSATGRDAAPAASANPSSSPLPLYPVRLPTPKECSEMPFGRTNSLHFSFCSNGVADGARVGSFEPAAAAPAAAVKLLTFDNTSVGEKHAESLISAPVIGNAVPISDPSQAAATAATGNLPQDSKSHAPLRIELPGKTGSTAAEGVLSGNRAAEEVGNSACSSIHTPNLLRQETMLPIAGKSPTDTSQLVHEHLTDQERTNAFHLLALQREMDPPPTTHPNTARPSKVRHRSPAKAPEEVAKPIDAALAEFLLEQTKLDVAHWHAFNEVQRREIGVLVQRIAAARQAGRLLLKGDLSGVFDTQALNPVAAPLPTASHMQTSTAGAMQRHENRCPPAESAPGIVAKRDGYTTLHHSSKAAHAVSSTRASKKQCCGPLPREESPQPLRVKHEVDFSATAVAPGWCRSQRSGAPPSGEVPAASGFTFAQSRDLSRRDVYTSTAAAFGVVWPPFSDREMYFATGVRLTPPQVSHFFFIVRQREVAKAEEEADIQRLLGTYGVDLRNTASANNHQTRRRSLAGPAGDDGAPAPVSDADIPHFYGLRAQSRSGHPSGGPANGAVPYGRDGSSRPAATPPRYAGGSKRTFVLRKVFSLLDVGQTGVLLRRDLKPLMRLLRADLRDAETHGLSGSTAGSPKAPQSQPLGVTSLLSAALREQYKLRFNGAADGQRRSLYGPRSDTQYLCLCEFACNVVLPILLQSSFIEMDFPCVALLVFGVLNHHATARQRYTSATAAEAKPAGGLHWYSLVNHYFTVLG